MYLLLIFLPLIGSLCAGLFGRKLGPFGASYITVSCLLFTFFISLFAFYEVALLNSCVYIKLAPWINSEMLNVDWGFLFDSLTVVMCCVVTFVSSIVHLYSTEYMAYDPHLPRFMSYLSLFTFFMLILVTADNFIQMFVGWEGVGLCSYLLINFWFTRIQANKAAIKAMILNRIEDFGLVQIYHYLTFKKQEFKFRNFNTTALIFASGSKPPGGPNFFIVILLAIGFWVAGLVTADVNEIIADINEIVTIAGLNHLVGYLNLYMLSLDILFNQVSTYVICLPSGAGFIINFIASSATDQMPLVLLEIGKMHVELLANLFECILDCARGNEFQAEVIQTHITRLDDFIKMSKHFIFSHILGCNDVASDWESLHRNSAFEFYRFCETQCLSNGINFALINDLLSFFTALEPMVSINKCERLYEMLRTNPQIADMLNGVVQSIRIGIWQNV